MLFVSFDLDPPYWQTEGYGVPFEFDQYVRMAELMRRTSGRMMVSINDHPDIRRVFEGLTMLELEICYTVSAKKGDMPTSRELTIVNWKPDAGAGLLGADASLGFPCLLLGSGIAMVVLDMLTNPDYLRQVAGAASTGSS